MTFWPIFAAFFAALMMSLFLVMTQKFHGKFTLDSQGGIQKVHKIPTPRVGGVAILSGAVIGGIALPREIQWDFWMTLSAGFFAYAGGLIEDITKRVGVKFRLLMTFVSGLVFCIGTGYGIFWLGIPGVDLVLSISPLAVLFSAFAIAGIANAINIIDGVNGLASGTAIIIFAGFAILAHRHDDQLVLMLCMVMIAALAGFFLLNFPLGKLFLGDAGAYSTGYLLAATAIMLPLRNPEITSVIGLLALSYPVIETLVSIQRRISRTGTNPGQPDRLHLHSLVYQRRAGRLAELLGLPGMRNPATSVIVLTLPAFSTLLMMPVSGDKWIALFCTLLVGVVYLSVYRRVAMMSSLFPFVTTFRTFLRGARTPEIRPQHEEAK